MGQAAPDHDIEVTDIKPKVSSSETVSTTVVTPPQPAKE